MKRKTTVTLKSPGPRNPFVAASLFKKAGSHRKTEKSIRRREKVETGLVAQGESNRLLTGRPRFDPERVYQLTEVS